MYTPRNIANSQTDWVPTKINKNGVVSGTRDTISHLKTCRVISNEMPVLHILVDTILVV